MDKAMKGARFWAPGVAVCAAAGALVGAGGYTVHTSGATSYLSDDPRACVNCHVMRDPYDGWQKAGHHDRATCNDCHVPQALVPKYVSKAINGYRHAKGFTFEDFHEPIRIRPGNARVLNENCVRCHAALVHEILPGERLDCVRCHAQAGHGPTR
jgi:cytochrome c nitrite reductase small subunit